jgi:hypothetical protein
VWLLERRRGVAIYAGDATQAPGGNKAAAPQFAITPREKGLVISRPSCWGVLENWSFSDQFSTAKFCLIGNR